MLFSIRRTITRKTTHIHLMEALQSLVNKSIIRTYLDEVQLPVTPWLCEPNGFWNPLVFDFETIMFDRVYADAIFDWIQKWWWMSIVLSIIYICLIYYGRWLMDSRKRFEVRILLILWNISLALFSIFGAIRCVPSIFYSLKNESLYKSICDQSTIYGVTGFWWVYETYKSDLTIIWCSPFHFRFAGLQYSVRRKCLNCLTRYSLCFESRNYIFSIGFIMLQCSYMSPIGEWLTALSSMEPWCCEAFDLACGACM